MGKVIFFYLILIEIEYRFIIQFARLADSLDFGCHFQFEMNIQSQPLHKSCIHITCIGVCPCVWLDFVHADENTG